MIFLRSNNRLTIKLIVTWSVWKESKYASCYNFLLGISFGKPKFEKNLKYKRWTTKSKHTWERDLGKGLELPLWKACRKNNQKKRNKPLVSKQPVARPIVKNPFSRTCSSLSRTKYVFKTVEIKSNNGWLNKNKRFLVASISVTWLMKEKPTVAVEGGGGCEWLLLRLERRRKRSCAVLNRWIH